MLQPPQQSHVHSGRALWQQQQQHPAAPSPGTALFNEATPVPMDFARGPSSTPGAFSFQSCPETLPRSASLGPASRPPEPPHASGRAGPSPLQPPPEQQQPNLQAPQQAGAGEGGKSALELKQEILDGLKPRLKAKLGEGLLTRDTYKVVRGLPRRAAHAMHAALSCCTAPSWSCHASASGPDIASRA